MLSTEKLVAFNVWTIKSKGHGFQPQTRNSASWALELLSALAIMAPQAVELVTRLIYVAWVTWSVALAHASPTMNESWGHHKMKRFGQSDVNLIWNRCHPANLLNNSSSFRDHMSSVCGTLKSLFYPENAYSRQLTYRDKSTVDSCAIPWLLFIEFQGCRWRTSFSFALNRERLRRLIIKGINLVRDR